MANRRMNLIEGFSVVGLAIGVPTLALADVDLKPIGTFSNWTAYELNDGNLRICFAETHLAERPTPDKRIEGVRLMVTHQAMGFGGDMVRVSIDEAPFDGAYDFLLSFGDNGYRPPFDFEDRELPRWSEGYAYIVDKIKAAESAGRPATLGGTGRFSLSGFSEAYEAIKKSCSRAGESLFPHPVYVSDVRIQLPPPEAASLSEDERDDLYHEWLSKEPYMEFDVIGRSFFGGEEEETLTLRLSLGDKEGRPEYVAMLAENPKFNYAVLSYATRRMDYFRNGKLFHSDDSFWHSSQVEFEGACAGPRDGRLNLLFSQWYGGASFGMEDSAAKFEPNEGISWASIKGPIDVPLQKADCAEGQEYWKEGGAFTPCVCRHFDSDNSYDDNLTEWWQGFVSAARDDKGMEGDTLASFLNSDLVPFLRWDARVYLDIRYFESTEYEVVSVKFNFGPEVYQAFQVVLARRHSESVWFKIYDADLDHRRLDEVAIYGFEAPHLLKRSGGDYESYEDQVIDLNELLSDTLADSQIEP